MRFTENLILLNPPKTGSRFCQAYVKGGVWHSGCTDRDRHAALHELPAEIVKNRTVYCMTRNPFRWYESWYAHMRRAPGMPWNHMWGHVGEVPFKDALYDYCYGWKKADNAPTAYRINHLANQATLKCGWWSYQMRWTACRPWNKWNTRAKWIWLDVNLVQSLRDAGFEAQVGSDVRSGAADYKRPVWDEEMCGWVEDMDVPTLELMTQPKNAGG
jgi:hypothetical protein